MYKISLVLLLSFNFCTSFLEAMILEISEMEQILPFVTTDTLCLFDIDETLISSSSSLGSSSWRSWAKPLASEKYDRLTLAIAKKVPYKTVEPTTAQLISDLQESGVAALAYTARGRNEWYSTTIEGIDRFTHEQLLSVGIDFAKTQMAEEMQLIDPTYLSEGILFAKHLNKGELLKILFKNYHPWVVIFVDDKLDAVQSVETALSELSIPSFVFWYNPKQKAFNSLLSTIQMEALFLHDKILSDEEAEQLLLEKANLDPTLYFKEIITQIDLS